jgi:hypothetical protein
MRFLYGNLSKGELLDGLLTNVERLGVIGKASPKTIL